MEVRISSFSFVVAEEIGYVIPTEVQLQALPFLFSGRDCVLHAQTGSGKTLAYLLQVLSVIDSQRSAVQHLSWCLLGSLVTKVARMLAANPSECESGMKSCTVMALLDGGMLKRHKSWIVRELVLTSVASLPTHLFCLLLLFLPEIKRKLQHIFTRCDSKMFVPLQAEPPTIVIATIGSLCQMVEKHILKLDSCQVLVVDEVDFMFNSSKEISSLKRLLTSYSSSKNCQTIFASASIPQHRRFLYDCMQQKLTRDDVVHVHVNSVEPMPSCLHHRFVSEKSKKTGSAPTLLVDFLRSCGRFSDVSLLEEDMNFNQRAASLSELRGGGYLLVATDIAARGVDLPETTHIYNFDIPKDEVNYLHRAGRTGRKPFQMKDVLLPAL
ncbi:hypothetical protein RND71_007838 [Anisodus tanguticus]|uniref:RNA helicase n=1 Tax=Anisodus tanguticus TaxID=243964 RepID=A0AAE1SMJ2_9SOLA|nr:hypothetical protein RND71_007838 [Anisodus tanguticus]